MDRSRRPSALNVRFPLFHEVAHGLGITHTIDGTATGREALRDKAFAIEEGKADIQGLYLAIKLHEQGDLAARLDADVGAAG